MVLSDCFHAYFCSWYLDPLSDVEVIPFMTLPVSHNLCLSFTIHLKKKKINQNRIV